MTVFSKIMVLKEGSGIQMYHDYILTFFMRREILLCRTVLTLGDNSISEFLNFENYAVSEDQDGQV